MTQSMINKMKSLYQREFNVRETLFVLTYNKTIFFSWGASKITNFENKGLCFKVNGNHLNGYVFIALGWNDTYSVYFFNEKGELQDSKKDVYFDMLVDIIDSRIEKIEEYEY